MNGSNGRIYASAIPGANNKVPNVKDTSEIIELKMPPTMPTAYIEAPIFMRFEPRMDRSEIGKPPLGTTFPSQGRFPERTALLTTPDLSTALAKLFTILTNPPVRLPD